MANDLTLSLGFEVDTGTIQSALQDQLGEFAKGMTTLEESVQALRTILSDLATPMTTLRDLAKETAAAFADMRSAAQTVKDTVAATSIQPGGGGGGGGIGGGGFRGGGIDRCGYPASYRAKWHQVDTKSAPSRNPEPMRGREAYRRSDGNSKTYRPQ